MLMSIGQFAFETDTALFDQLRRRRSWRHPASDRVAARPARQFAGPDEDSISLSGRIYPGQLGNPDSLTELAEMADTGQAWSLVGGEGEVYGAFVILSQDETHRALLPDGRGLVIDFSLDLTRVDDDEAEEGQARR